MKRRPFPTAKVVLYATAVTAVVAAVPALGWPNTMAGQMGVVVLMACTSCFVAALMWLGVE